MSTKAGEEFIRVWSDVEIPFHQYAGHYLSKFYNKMKNDGEIWAVRCPECHQVIVPPMMVCGFCKVTIEDKPENWLKLSDQGTLVRHLFIEEMEADKTKGQVTAAPNPVGFIRLDGGDEYSILCHWLEMIEPEKLKDGMHFQAVWKPKEERRGRMSDISYFKVVEA